MSELKAARSPAFSVWPQYAEDEIEAVNRVLRSGRGNKWYGSECAEFEKEFAAYCGTSYAIALANGTLALELALIASGIGKGDEVVVTPRSFVASAACVQVCGARPVFADVDRDSQNLTVDTIRTALSPRTRAVIVVHLAGRPCEMDAILELAREHGIMVIEDCAQAHGARYREKRVGSIGHIAAFSFCHDKIMSTGGEGGMLLTSDENIWRRAWAYKDHGKNPDKMRTPSPPWQFRWVHDSFGTNWRMTEMQAAIGRVQLGKLENWLARRRSHAAVLDAELSRHPGLRLESVPPHIKHAYYKYYAFVRTEQLQHGWNRDRILQHLHEAGIPCFAGSCSEIYLERSFEESGLRPHARLPIAQELGETSLMLPVHPTLSQEDVQFIGRRVAETVGIATSK
jgi:dTDP-4-amino-4,6-dideoxygalactose transaminase